MTTITAMTINFIAPQHVTFAANGRSRSMLRAGRRLTGMVRASLHVTAQDRTSRYVARMPIAVLATSP